MMSCENCNASLKAHQNYCSICGAKVIRNRLTVKNLSADISEQFLDYDNALFKTIKDLTIKPHVVIDSFIKGTRKKYLNVLQYFAISLTLLGFQIFILKNIFPEFLKPTSFFGANENLPEFYNDAMGKFFDYQSAMYITTLPLVAFSTWLVFKDSKIYNYTEHIVINLYITAHFLVISSLVFILFAIVGINYSIASLIVTIPFFIYNAVIFKNLYRLTFWETIARGALVFVLYLIISMVFFIAVVIIWVLYLKLTGGTLPVTTIQ